MRREARSAGGADRATGPRFGGRGDEPRVVRGVIPRAMDPRGSRAEVTRPRARAHRSARPVGC